MGSNYRAQRVRNMYRPGLNFTLSRSKIELFIQCPRCFYFDRRLGVGRPSMPAFTLNSAVDSLLKKEFDQFRERQTTHPYMVKAGIKAVPFKDARLDLWRNALHGGVKVEHPTGLTITGAVDDLWETPSGELIVVDYKATSRKTEVTLDDQWQESYKRQLAIYSWLLRQNGFRVHKTGYFLYCNGDSNRNDFGAQLHFHISVLAYEIDDSWVDDAIRAAYECLNLSSPPWPEGDCSFCSYTEARDVWELKFESR